MTPIEAAKLERERCLDELYEWLEIGVECEKPNAVIVQMVDKIQSMRNESFVINYSRVVKP
jgi:hypothetical protein